MRAGRHPVRARGSGQPPARRSIVIAGGAGIPRRYYARFAAYLAERGRPVLTFDYRDIGGSRRGSLQGLRRAHARLVHPRRAGRARLGRAHLSRAGRSHWVGHSMGGFATGLAHNNHLIARQLNVATLSGYWGRMAAPERYRVRVLMGCAGAARRARARLFPRRADGRRGHAGPRLPRVAPLVHDARVPVRRSDADRDRTTSPSFRAPHPLRPDRGRPLGHAGRRRPHGRALHRPASSAPSGASASPTPAAAKIGHFGFFRPRVPRHALAAAATGSRPLPVRSRGEGRREGQLARCSRRLPLTLALSP